MDNEITGASVPALCAGNTAGWSGVGPTPSPTVVRWQEDPHRTEFFVQGQLIRTLKHQGLIVSACLEDTGREMQAMVAVVDHTDHSIDVVPSLMTLEVTKPQEKSLPFLNPEKLAKSTRRVSRWNYVLAGMADSIGSETSHTTGTVGGENVDLT